MKSTILKTALGAVVLCSATPAFADLVYVNGAQIPGTGLGTVPTVVTVLDNGNGAQQNDIESGCVTHVAGGDPATPTTACQFGLQGGDNTSGNVGSNTWLLNQIAGLNNAGELAFVLNISEGGNGGTATLTDLYMSLFNTSTNLYDYYQYTGADLALSDTGGIGQSGDHLFALNFAQSVQAAAFCPILSQCIVGGGVQFGQGTTSATPETLYVTYLRRDDTVPSNDIPEPGSLALMGVGALAVGFVSRRYGKRKA